MHICVYIKYSGEDLYFKKARENMRDKKENKHFPKLNLELNIVNSGLVIGMMATFIEKLYILLLLKKEKQKSV